MSPQLRLPIATIAVAAFTFSEAAAALPRASSTVEQQQAQAIYEQGVESYRHGRFRTAIAHFLAADELAPSPALAFNAARAYEKLGEKARALQHYRDYLRRGADPSNAREVERRVQELEGALAKQGIQQLTVLSDPAGASLRVSGTERGRTPWTGELPLGPQELTVAREGYVSKHVKLEVQADKARDILITLPRLTQRSRRNSSANTGSSLGAVAPSASGASAAHTNVGRSAPQSSWQPWPWVTVGAGGLSLAGAGLFELLRRDAESEAKQARTQLAYHQQRERMERHQTTARIFAGAGTALVIGGGILLLVDAVTAEEFERAPVALSCDTAACLGVWNASF